MGHRNGDGDACSARLIAGDSGPTRSRGRERAVPEVGRPVGREIGSTRSMASSSDVMQANLRASRLKSCAVARWNTAARIRMTAREACEKTI